MPNKNVCILINNNNFNNSVEDHRRMSDDLIPIYIKNLVGKTQRIWIDKRAPITTIHWPILSAFGVTHDQQRLIYCGVQLRLENTFDVYNVYKEAFIHVVARLRGTDGNYANIYRDMDIGKKYITPVEVQMKHLKLEIHSNFPKDLKGAWSASINYDREAYMTEAPPKTKKPKKQKDLPKDWEKQARNVMPETLKSLGYDQKNIDLVIKTLNPVDAQVAVTWLQKNAIIDKIQDLAPLFEKYPDVLAEHLLKYFTLAERVKLSTVSKTFNKMTRSPLAWKNLVLVSDWMDMTDKSFTKTMKEYGHSIERLSIQRCCYLTPNATKLIGDHCPNLKEIYGGDCPSMTSTVIEHILSKCLKLEVVDLRFMAPGIPFAVEKVPSVKNLPNLRVLNLANRIYAENSEISSSSLKILVIKDSFTEGGYSSLKINCPNLTHMLTNNDKHKVSDSLKKTVSVNQPLHGITVHTYSGSGCGDFFMPKVMTKEEVKAIINYELDDGTTLWICK